MGRRVKKAVYAYGAGGWELQKEILFVYDGWNLIHEKEVSAAGDPLFDKLYVWGLDLSQSIQVAGGIGGLVCRVSGGEVHHYFYDANGNVGQMVNPADGAVTARYEYDPFGKAVFVDGADAPGNGFRFSTKYFDIATGLNYYGFRYYSRDFARWVNRDPIHELRHQLLRSWKLEENSRTISGNVVFPTHCYLFIKNNPVNLIDLFGLKDESLYKALILKADKLTFLSDSVKNDYILFWKSIELKAQLIFDSLEDQYPVEHWIAKEYGNKFYYNYRCCRMKCFAMLWKDFTPYCKKKSKEIFYNSFEYFIKLIYEPQGKIPIIGDILTILSTRKLDKKYMKNELVELMNDPQILNESYFQKIFGKSTSYYINIED